MLLFYFAYKLLEACAVKFILHFYQHLGIDRGARALGPKKKNKKNLKPLPKEIFFIGYIYIYIYIFLISNRNSINHEERVNKTSIGCS